MPNLSRNLKVSTDFESKMTVFESKLARFGSVMGMKSYFSYICLGELRMRYFKINNRMDINNLKSYSTFDSFSRFETRSNWRLLTQII